MACTVVETKYSAIQHNRGAVIIIIIIKMLCIILYCNYLFLQRNILRSSIATNIYPHLTYRKFLYPTIITFKITQIDGQCCFNSPERYNIRRLKTESSDGVIMFLQGKYRFPSQFDYLHYNQIKGSKQTESYF